MISEETNEYVKRVREAARIELNEEFFRKRVEEEKARMRAGNWYTRLWGKLFPWKIIIIRKARDV
jgi:hypothetical protein